jgi:hypothetical protein
MVMMFLSERQARRPAAIAAVLTGWLRLSEDEMSEIKAIAKGCEVEPTTLAAFFVRAALRAVREDGSRLRLPPFFELKPEPDEKFRLNEPKPPRLRWRAGTARQCFSNTTGRLSRRPLQRSFGRLCRDYHAFFSRVTVSKEFPFSKRSTTLSEKRIVRFVGRKAVGLSGRAMRFTLETWSRQRSAKS